MYKKTEGSVYRNAVSAGSVRASGNVGRVSCEELSAVLAGYRPVTILISQRNRGGLRAWPPSGLFPDVVLTLNHGDEVAEAVRICARGNQMYGWPVVCVVMGAAHAYARIEAAVKAVPSDEVQVLVVEGR